MQRAPIPRLARNLLVNPSSSVYEHLKRPYASTASTASTARTAMTSTATTDEIIAKLVDRPTLPPLEPGDKVFAPELTPQIKGLKEHKFVIAAIHLLNDDIHNAHLIAQSNEGDVTADLLHATLHRREGDYWNSKYWWSHVRSHPTIKSSSDAKAFVDQCEAVRGKGEESTKKLRERQWEELQRLVQWTRDNC